MGCSVFWQEEKQNPGIQFQTEKTKEWFLFVHVVKTDESKLKSKLFQQLKIVQHNEIKLKHWSPCRNKWIKDLSSSEQLYPPGLCLCIYILIS